MEKAVSEALSSHDDSSRILGIELWLDCVAFGFVLADCNARLIYANQCAQRLIKRSDGLGSQAGLLAARYAGESRQLRQAIAAVARATNGGAAALRLTRPSRARALELVIRAVPSSRQGPRIGLVGIVVCDPSAGGKPDPEVLRQLYRLTPAEARVAALLVAGDTAGRIAEQLGISPRTARVHIERIMKKTGTRRQVELVAALLRGPACAPAWTSN